MSTASPKVEQLNPVTFPLHGSRLIEASAGTGKTFTIALLYVRLVLGNSKDADTFPPPLTPKQILVVTFTELAAGELRDRIRARLVEAAEYFLQPEQTDDPLLVQLRDEHPETNWPGCAWRLQTASQSMDEASISTIHSWCNRMLVEHAFDTGGLFNREMLTDSSELLTQVVEDYWRLHFYQLDSGAARELCGVFASPAALQHRLRDMLKPGNLGVSFKGTPVTPSPTVFLDVLREQSEIRQKKAQAEQAAREEWAHNWDDIRKHLLELQPHLNGTCHGSAKPDKFEELLESIRQWAFEEAEAPGKLVSFASGSFKFKKTAKISEEKPLKAFDLIARLNEYTQLQPGQSLASAVLAHAADWVRYTFEQRMQQNAHMGFDDLLVQLERALNPELAADHAKQLAITLKRNFPVAMIDEFQDTDPIQFNIFDRIYQVKDNREDCGIFMIGDPKQSIYAFRGADINTYLDVRKLTEGRHYTLKKNFRSTTAVVDACNAFFRFGEQHTTGAFQYRSEGENPLPFIEVNANGRKEQLFLQGEPAEPMTFWYFKQDEGEPQLSIRDYRQQAASTTASQIARWLNAASQNQAGFGEQAIERPLQPADIAILVRSGNEAQLLHRELAERRIYSVYLSDRESIFASRQAVDCLHWLRACADPGNEQQVRAALGTLTLNLPLQQLARWQEDELAWEEQMQQFARLHQIWRKQGVLVMLRRLQQSYDLPSRLLRKSDGERILTNLLHLGEWLQSAAGQLDGEQALIRHLAEHLDSHDEQQLLRLESDAQRVKILTIHKSKGLEYPLVLLPFISAWSSMGNRSPQVPLHLEQGLYVEVAGKKDYANAWELAQRERMREDLRLLYVALTRASHALWLGIGPLAEAAGRKNIELHNSAMGYILAGGAAFDSPDALHDRLKELVKNSAMCLQDAPFADDRLAPLPVETPLEGARPAPQLGNLHNWWIASYSALHFAGQTAPVEDMPDEPASAREDQSIEIAHTSAQQELQPQNSKLEPDDFIHAFPRGAQWGTFLHSLLEWAAKASNGTQHGFAAAAKNDTERRKMLAQRCKLRNIAHLAEPLDTWLQTFICQHWTQTGFALTDISPQQQAVELEFLLEVHQVNAQTLDALIRPHTLNGASAPQASAKQLNGMLKGFIDLVVEYQGRYYLIDWKSNHLGNDDSAYDKSAMRSAILQHRYDMQYMLYILALHRQLRSRLPDYDYDRHMGGAVYSFLRGWQNQDTQGLFHDRPPRELIEQMDALFNHGGQP